MLLIAKTFAGCEEILSQELEALGATETRILTRAVEFEGDLALMYKANLHCRTALRILKPMYHFEAADEDMLYHEIQNIDWKQHFSLHQTFAINATLNQSSLDHSLYAALKAKDAIVDQFRDETGDRPNVDVEQPDFRIHIHIYEDNCTLSFDSSGESLHKRGYRDYTNQAPINEALAAALVLLSGWDRKMPMADYMCGSGTILIEAAMIALNIAPNKHKQRFGFEGWKDFDDALWKQIYKDAIAAELKPEGLQLYGADISGTVLDKARQNIEHAGLSDVIRLRKCPFEKFPVPAEEGVLICNPPYGLRIEPKDIMDMYQRMGDKMKQDFKGWTCWIFTGNLEVAKFIGLRPSRKMQLYNGPIECRFLKFEIYSGSKKASKQV
ncbi:MAG: class I SAM-dependent RNA methyltransferase [Bacteroidetes bacterium]|nr:class I SAM-dependent RNA methyltransferase [Bacteroidota bacterium]